MDGRAPVVLVGDGESAAAVADQLDTVDLPVVEVPTVDDVADALDAEDAGSIVADGTSLADELDDLLAAAGDIPVVVFSDRSAGPSLEALLDDGVADVVTYDGAPSDGDLRLLARRVRSLASSPGSAADATAEPAGGSERPAERADLLERLEHLHRIAARLEPIESERDTYAHMVDHAEEVLPLSACAIGELEDGRIVPRAATASDLHLDVDPLAAGEGIAGRTIAEGRTIHSDDVTADTDARTGAVDYRSVLSVPLGEAAVFQVLADEPDAYTDLDRGLAELFATIVEYARNQVTYKAAVARERDRFAALFENIPDAAVQYTVEGDRLRIDSVNGPFVRLFGFEAEDAVGRAVRDLLVPDEERDAAESLHDDVVAGRRVEREVERRTDEGTAPFLLRNVPIRGDDGAERGYLIYTDIEPLKERERQLETQNERLDRFASIISHDLRNPLSAAMGRAELAVETEELDHVETVRQELDRMERMIGELLTLAREGEVIAETAPVDLGVAAREAWTHVDTDEATLVVDDPPTVEADRARVEELYENCFRNAVEHGGSDVSVTVGSLDGPADNSGAAGVGLTDDATGFYIEDDGVGIPDDRKGAVLETGFTTASDGTGFGLSIVQEIAEPHGWSVAVADAADGGARIEFRTGTGGFESPAES